MPIIVACPACGRKLRVADALRGRQARCPACDHTFDTGPAAEPPPAPAAEPRPAWSDLNLELSESPADKPPPLGGGTPGLVGAVELKLSLDEEPSPAPPRPAAVPPAPPAPEPAKPPRLGDTDDDLQTCPVCGKHVHRGAVRCRHCGERLDRPGRDRARPPIVREPRRRDLEPDRGGLVLTMGILGLVMFAVCGPLGIIFAIAGWVMGQGDLRKIKAGRMDPEGQGMTYAGWLCGIIGTILNLLYLLACVGFIGIAILGSNTPTTRKAAPQTIRVQPWDGNKRVR